MPRMPIQPMRNTGGHSGMEWRRCSATAPRRGRAMAMGTQTMRTPMATALITAACTMSGRLAWAHRGAQGRELRARSG